VSVLVRDRAVRGAAACAVIAGLTVVALPSVARAEGGAGPVPVVSDVALPDVDGATSTDAIAEALAPVEVASNVLEGTLAEVADETPAAESDSAPTDAAATVDPAPTDAPTTVEGNETPVTAPSNADTTRPSADTTADTASAGPAAPRTTSDAVAVQASPTNVNVSIRVESPGDNGSVTQLNVAAATAVGAAVEATAKTAPAAATTDGSSPPSSAAGAAVSSANPTAISSAATDADTWTWDWDCLSIPTFSTISPAISIGGTVPTTWTWNWNCGDNSDQYHGATVAQYHPVNVNVAIRISSPGNDGPVTQTNIAVAVSAGLALSSGPSSVEPPGAGSAPQSLASVSAPDTALPNSVESVAPTELISAAEEGSLLSGPMPSPAIPEVLHGALVPGVPFAASPDPVVGQLAGPVLATRVSWLPGGATRGPIDVSGAEAQGSSASGANRAKPESRWRRPAEKPLDYASAPSGASVAPAPGGGSSGGGLPIFLALPFIVAVLDLARRVALDRVASPSEHRDRRPDTPG
jgi:hypothetical protein